jgi:hypothetical protein
LVHELCVPSSKHNKFDKVVLESKEDIKKRGEASPDNADSLCTTFAAYIAPVKRDPVPAQPTPMYTNDSWMG